MPGFNFVPDPRRISTLAESLTCKSLQALRSHHEGGWRKLMPALATLIVTGLACIIVLTRLGVVAEYGIYTMALFAPASAMALVVIYHLRRSEIYECAIAHKNCAQTPRASVS